MEKSSQLGGWAGKLFKKVPEKMPFKDAHETEIVELIDVAKSLSTIHLNLTVTKPLGLQAGPVQISIRKAVAQLLKILVQ